MLRALLVTALILPAPAFAAEDDGWPAFGHALTLIQTLVRIGAHSDNPVQGFDDVLAGRDEDANRAAFGLMQEITADMPPEYRSKMASIGMDLAAMARKNARAGTGGTSSNEAALQARKELHAMGLSYYDEKQYRDAVKRGDKIAVDLFVAAQGIPALRNPPAAR